MSNIVYMVVWRRNYESSIDDSVFCNLLIETRATTTDPQAALKRAYKNVRIHSPNTYYIVTMDASTCTAVDVSLASEFKES